jgi:translation elongation factor P/translation initiation factor 5A
MQTILPSEFKRQMVLMLDGAPHVIEDMHTSGTAQTRHKLHTRLRHLTTGRLIDRVFAENERVPVAPLETRRATYSNAKADGQVFIDIETFDVFEFSNEQLGERRWFSVVQRGGHNSPCWNFCQIVCQLAHKAVKATRSLKWAARWPPLNSNQMSGNPVRIGDGCATVTGY